MVKNKRDEKVARKAIRTIDTLIFFFFFFFKIKDIYRRKESMKKTENARKEVFVCEYVVVSEKAMAPHSSTLALKIPWTEQPGRLQSMGSLRVRHD